MAAKLNNMKPAVGKKTLTCLSGLVWTGAGLLLLSFSYGWLTAYDGNTLFFILPGVAAALVIHHFGFLRIVDKNLGRISRMNEKSCVFSFMAWKSYAIMVLMIGMGTALRHSAIPKHFLAMLYIAIGLSLMLSSLRYIRIFIIQAFVKP